MFGNWSLNTRFPSSQRNLHNSNETNRCMWSTWVEICVHSKCSSKHDVNGVFLFIYLRFTTICGHSNISFSFKASLFPFHLNYDVATSPPLRSPPQLSLIFICPSGFHFRWASLKIQSHYRTKYENTFMWPTSPCWHPGWSINQRYRMFCLKISHLCRREGKLLH